LNEQNSTVLFYSLFLNLFCTSKNKKFLFGESIEIGQFIETTKTKSLLFSMSEKRTNSNFVLRFLKILKQKFAENIASSAIPFNEKSLCQ